MKKKIKEVSKEETRKEEVETSTSSSDSLKTLEFLKISGALEVSEEDLEEFKSLDEDQKQVVKDYFEEAVEIDLQRVLKSYQNL